jgi:drug/metabolite transporter (DMT)-like permease
MSKGRFNPWLLLFIGVFCISWSGIFVKLAGVPGFTSAFYRLFLALILIIPLVIYKKAWKISWPNFWFAFIGGMFFSFDLACWHLSLLRSQATVSTLLANCAPIWVGLGGFFLLKRRNGKQFWFGAIMALVGICILVGINKLLHLQVDLGVSLALIASAFYGSYLLTTEQLRKQLSTITFMFYALVGSAITSYLICIVGNTPLTGFSINSWYYLWGLAIIPHLAGWLTINYSLGYIKSNIASVSLLSQSLFTAVIAAFILHETLGIYQIIGGIVVLVGIYIVSYSPSTKEQKVVD